MRGLFSQKNQSDIRVCSCLYSCSNANYEIGIHYTQARNKFQYTENKDTRTLSPEKQVLKQIHYRNLSG